MPYFIAKDREGCKSGWATIGPTGTIHGCHSTKESAIKQAVAISLSTGEPFGGERALSDEIAVGDYVGWIAGLEAYFGEILELDSDMAQVLVYDEEEGQWMDTGLIAIVPIVDLKKIARLTAMAEESPSSDTTSPDEYMQRKSNLIEKLSARSKAKSGAKEERINIVDFEVRESGNGMTFVGYAAVFDSPSQPLPFVERIQRGAFKKTLQSRNEIKLLWNHDSGQVLGSLRAGTLRLTEDNVGLRVEADLPDTQLGRDTSILLKRGDVSNMSFGFSVPAGGDVWSQDGSERTLKSIRLHEVSIVAFPAYSASSAAVRTEQRSTIDIETLAEAMLKIQDGVALSDDEALLIKAAAAALEPTEEKPEDSVADVETNLLELKRKQLELLKKKD